MALGNFFTTTPARSQQFSTLTPQQLGVKGAASNQALQMLQGLGGGNFNFEPIAQQARSQFETQTVPGLAERFTSLGNGAQRSSAFTGQLGQAGAGLEQGLAALKSQFGQQQQGLDQNLLQLLLSHSLSPEVDTGIDQEEPGFLERVGPSILPILTSLIGAYFGGPAGAAAGGAGGNALNGLISNLFGGGNSSQPQRNTGNINTPDYSSLINNILQERS